MATNNSVNVTLSGQSGTGSFAGTTSPTLVTPVLGVAAATSINFGVDSLNAYSTSTSWTPVVTFATPGNLSVAYATQVGLYSRVGNVVFIEFALLFTPTFTTASGNFEITGLPFTSNATTGTTCRGVAIPSGVTFPAGCTQLTCGVATNSTLITVVGTGTTVALVNLTTTGFTTGVQAAMNGTVFYML
jgi:hypothetical protein